MQLNASNNTLNFNDSISGISTISSVYYLVPAGTLEIIHNADEKIVVGTSNDQVITGNKRFAKSNDINIPSPGKIEIGTMSYGGEVYPSLTILADKYGDSIITSSSFGSITIDNVMFSGNAIRPEGASHSINLGADLIR